MMTSSLTEALGWTLLHSLWQATLVAGVFYLVRPLIRHRPTQVYFGALGAIAVVLGWSLHTFVNLYTPESSTSHPAVIHPAPMTPPATAAPLVTESVASAKPTDLSWVAVGVAWINSYINFVAMAWLFGMVILSARLAGGLWYLERLRHHRACPVPAWEATVVTLADRLGIRRPVTLLASSRTRVPMVIGHLKPIILLPVALLSSLSPELIEAIIAHELAHIRRQDYVTNVLQSCVEILYFYHPAVRWLSSVVRDEREKCCDDLAVSLSGNTIAYAKALAEAERLQHPADPLVMAFAPRRGSLLSRVERLVGPRTSSTRRAAKGWFIVPMLLIVTYLAGSDTLARKAASSEPPLASSVFSDISKRLPSRTEVSLAPLTNQAQEDSDSGSTTNAVPNPLMASDTIPGESEKERESGSFSFHFNDSTTFSFDMNFNFDEEDSASHHGFRHWQFSSNGTPNFVWNDSLWRESIEELSETMNGFSEELVTYLEDSVDTEALQQRMNSVQRELSRLQAEIGTSMQRAFSDEKMEALQKKLQRKQERLGRDLQEKSRRLQKQQRQLQEEAQQRFKEVTGEEEMEALQKELQEAQERLQRELLDEQSWRNEESNRQLEEVQRAMEEMQQRNQDEPRHYSESKEDSLKFKESQRAFREKQRRFQKENQRRLKQLRAEARDQAQAHTQVHNSFDDTVNRLEEALLADGLIKSGQKYRFELKPKGLYINRKKQDEELLAKYRDLLDITENTSFSITRTAR